MLWRLEIDQLALIERAELELSEGFGVITGETGAGKSLLLGAIAAISGAAVSKDLIRSGADTALVEAVFLDVRRHFPDDEEVLSYLEEEDQLIIGREIRRNGRHLCRVNGRMVPLAFLKRIGGRLCDIHGQNDRQKIFEADKHLSLLDRFGREEIAPAKMAYHRAWQASVELSKQEKELLADPEERRMLTERLQYQINEIQNIDPQEGEDESLSRRRDLLANEEKLNLGIGAALQSLSGGSGAAEALALAFAEIRELTPYLEALGPAVSNLEQASELVRETVSSLHHISDSLDSRPGELEAVDGRLDAITRLKKKYGGDIEAVRHFLKLAEERLERIEQAAAMADEIREKRLRVTAVLNERGLALREARKKAAERLSRSIRKELKELGMTQADFSVRFTEKDVARAGAEGMETCEFMLAANRGEALKPLAQTASGGEASRIMLAIKVILAEADETPLLIFDEIDTGISGETTTIVAEKLKRLGKSHQVLCVTHQAQIAAAADYQFMIYKQSDAERTRTFIRPLGAEERARELSRLLSGNREDERSLELARQLLRQH